jgi:hypothetical protein
MPVSAEFKNAISSGDVLGVRIMIKNSLINDKTFAEYESKLQYAGKMPGLFDVHDGKPFKNRSEWTKDYMNEQLSHVVDNFSRDRLNHLKDVVRHVYGITSGTESEPRAASNSHSNSGARTASFDKGNSNAKAKSQTGGILVGVGAVTAGSGVVAAILGAKIATALIAGGVIIAAVGGVMLTSDKK